MLDAEARLSPEQAAMRAERLGFRGPDLDDVRTAAAQVLAAGDAGQVQRLAERLLPAIGDFASPSPFPPMDPWDDDAARSTAYGTGVVPMLALLVSADEVVEYHRSRGIAAELSWASLADLGQQVWVHRQTFGEFGLHTQGWLRIAWSGAFLWLGRLQFNLQRDDMDGGRWVLSTHIPQSGPLKPEAVDEAFARAADTFARHFPEQPISAFHCHSWLLDPQLTEELPTSNLADFQRRWQLSGDSVTGDSDVIFFVFRRRGPVDLTELPQQTSLERAVVAKLRAGGHWQVRSGLIGSVEAGSGYGE